MTATIVCERCGRAMQAGARFCVGCGSDLPPAPDYDALPPADPAEWPRVCKACGKRIADEDLVGIWPEWPQTGEILTPEERREAEASRSPRQPDPWEGKLELYWLGAYDQAERELRRPTSNPVILRYRVADAFVAQLVRQSGHKRRCHVVALDCPSCRQVDPVGLHAMVEEGVNAISEWRRSVTR